MTESPAGSQPLAESADNASIPLQATQRPADCRQELKVCDCMCKPMCLYSSLLACSPVRGIFVVCMCINVMSRVMHELSVEGMTR